jgi:lambda family phage portal protein
MPSIRKNISRFASNARKLFSGNVVVTTSNRTHGGRRTLPAANTGRLMANFNNMEPLEKILSSNWLIRERARFLEKSNDFAERFLLEARTNIPGPNGFTFQSIIKELKQDKNGNWNHIPDTLANTKIEEAFSEYSDSAEYCSIDGQYTRRGIEDALTMGWVRDGEAFLRVIPNADSKFGSQVQIVEPELIDEFFNKKLPNGNIVKMGIEIDKWRRPVAYYLKKKTTSSELWGYGTSHSSSDYEIIPAEEMLHLFDKKYPNQTRGISLLVQSMVRLKRLSDYEEAVLINAQYAASNPGFFSDKLPEESPDLQLGDAITKVNDEGNEEETGDETIELAPGKLEDIGFKEFTQMKAEFPSSQHEMMFKTTMHSVSAGMGDAYSSITNDLGDTSYSSSRTGLMDVREIYKLRQKIVIEKISMPWFTRWIKFAILNGAINLPISKLAKFTKPWFIGRRWGMMDPLKDVMAIALAIEYGLETRTQALAELGKDIEEVNAELAQEQQAAKTAGIVLKFNSELAMNAVNADNQSNNQSTNQKNNSSAQRSEEELMEERVLQQAMMILLKRKQNGHAKEAIAA